jgi:rhodanese-related sulfurtransferase
MLKVLSIILVAVTLLLSGPAWSYDTAMAASYAELFAPVKGAGAGKALHMIKPDAFLEKVKAKEPLVALDIRTPAETGVFTASLPGTLVIPFNELFMETKLAQIPTDKTVIVLCKSGTRATAAGTALRHIGFENVYVLKGGFKALIAYMGPKEANTPPESQPATKTPVERRPDGWPPVPAPYPARPTW